MLDFPPNRIPTATFLGIEPYRLAARKPDTSLTPKNSRADYLVYAEGLRAIEDRLLMTDSGTLIQVVDASAAGAWHARYFLWNGKTRRIVHAHDDASRKAMFELLADAWPYDHGIGDELYDEAQVRLKKALAYEKMSDIDIIAMNFELLRENSDRILETGYLRDGAVKDLFAVFCYLGKKGFPVAALLKAWDEGEWRIKCYKRKNEVHEAYVISGGGGFSMGVATAYCPVCRQVHRIETSFGCYFGAICKRAPAKSDGFRLDEIVEEIGGVLPDVAG